jgi:SAM-dependent methyltransferase
MDKRIHFNRFLVIVLSLLLASTGGYAQVTDKDFTPEVGLKGKDASWVPTPYSLVDSMINMAKVTSADYVIDLGSGDGRLVIAAAKRGATALGVEFNPDMVEYARRVAIEEGVSERVTFVEGDLLEYDFSKATVLTIFMWTEINMQIRPKILEMKPGTRIVTNTFHMEDWKPDQSTKIDEMVKWREAYLWIVPAKVDGKWKLKGGGRIKFTQTFQHITGTLTMGKVNTELTGKLNGNQISFNAGGTEFTGTVSGKTITGTRTGGDLWKATR